MSAQIKDSGPVDVLAAIQTTRAWYETTRRKSREQAGPRTDRGLPHHPDGSGLAPCPRCAGTGVIDCGHWQPELCTSATCSLCAGSGYVTDGYRDPLLRLRNARQRWQRRRNPGAYAHLRKLCATPCWSLRLIESVVGCELATVRVAGGRVMCDFTEQTPYIAELRARDAELHAALAEAIATATHTRDALDSALRTLSPDPDAVPPDSVVAPPGPSGAGDPLSEQLGQTKLEAHP